jgi:hypothetical protein
MKISVDNYINQIVSDLRREMDARILATDHAMELRFAAADRAVDLAAAAVKQHNAVTNEFREQLTLERYVSNLEGRFWALGAAIGIATALLTAGAMRLLGWAH